MANGTRPPLPFNRYPVGLLGLLDAKVRGQTPNELDQVTGASVELTPWLLEQAVECPNDLTAAIGAVGRFFGTNLNLVVPDNELWWVHAYSVRPSAVLGAGTTYAFRCIHESALAAGPSVQNLYARSDLASGTTGGQPMAGNGAPFLMSPGDRLGVYVESGTFGVAATFHEFAKITRLRV